MSRITFLGNFGVDYSSETHHKKSLESLGHEVIALQETQASAELIWAEALRSNMFVWVHTHGWQTPSGTGLTMETVLQNLKKKRIPSVAYHLDLWLGLQRERDLKRDPVYQYVEYFFTVDKKMADWFNDNTNVSGYYLPAGVFHEECRLELNERVNDIIFVGSKGYHPEWPWRPQLIDWLQNTYRNQFKHIGGDGLGVIRGQQLTDLYNSTKIVIGDSLVKNFTYSYYWSDRLYETIGRGGFIIFPYIRGLEEEFNVSDYETELVTYEFGNFDDLKKKIDYYLENFHEREEIRRRGYRKVVENYTYRDRWEYILSEVGLNG